MSSPLRLYGIPNCDTMKKARAWLASHGIEHEFIDYKKPGVAAAHLADWIARSDWETLLNRRGLTWKKLAESEREGITDAAQAERLMALHPTLIKRPVLDCGDVLLIGFDPERYAQALLSAAKL